VLVSLALLGSYVQSGKKWALAALGAVAGLSGLLHPFEVFTIMAASTLSLLCVEWPQFRRAATHALAVCIPGVLALLPYAYFSSHSDWMRRVTQMNHPPADKFYQILMELGIPAAAALTLLVIRPRMRKPLDVVLQSWFVATLVTLEVPGLPFRWHVVDGFAIVTALLLVRQFSTLSFLKARLTRRYAFAAAGVVLAFSVLVQADYRYLAVRDFEENSCSSQDEASTLAWLRRYASPDQLVLAPLESTPWVATAPIHTFASHWIFGITFPEQLKLARAFYSGTENADDVQLFLQRYGVNYVVAPSDGPAIRMLDPRRRVAQVGSWFLYYFPENRMATYSDFR
jgi:hypothetical protein